MSNLPQAVAVTASVLTPLSAMALANINSTDITSGPTRECVLLGEDIKIELSNKVHGAYDCDGLTPLIRFATCHEHGRYPPSTASCVRMGTDPTTNEPMWSDTSCNSADDSYAIDYYRGFVATNSGGAIGEQQLGDRCSNTSIGSVPLFSQWHLLPVPALSDQPGYLITRIGIQTHASPPATTIRC